jgi:TonB family protein
MFDHTNFKRILTATAGAALFSVTCIAGAVAPAKAADVAPITVADWQKNVDRQIDSTLQMPAGAISDGRAIASVAVQFDEHGGFDGASIAQSSGNAALDAEALRTARAIHYPVLPSGLRGRPQTVSMKLLFAQPADGNYAREQAAADQLVADARKSGPAPVQIASR